MPPALTVTFEPTARVRAVMSSNWSVPPPTTVTLSAAAAVSTVTVQPFVIVTSSAEVGTTPPLHVALELQGPPGAAQAMLARGTLGPLPARWPRRGSSPLGRTARAGAG